MGHKTPTVSKLILLGGAPLDHHVYVSSTGVLGTGPQTGFPGGAFTIRVAMEIQDADAFHASLKRIVRNTLSAYPIVDVVDGGGLPFDLKAWLREHRQDL